MDLKYIPFTAPGESRISQISGFFTIGCVLTVTVGLALFSEKLIGHFVGLGLTILIILWFKRFIRTVEFDIEKITVTYLYGNKKSIQYSQLKKFYKNREGFVPIFVYVIKFNENDMVKKITFWRSGIDEMDFKKELLTLKKKV